MRSEFPEFSIVIPLYNKRNEIVRSISSCLSQEFGDYEILVVNDGSTDGGGDLVMGMADDRVRLIQQENRGQGAARNCGIALARGRYVAFLDADDYWATNHLSELHKLLARSKLRHPVASCAFAYDKGGRIVKPEISQIVVSKGLLVNYIDVLTRSTSPITSNSIAYDRKYLVELGGFDEKIPLAQDIELWLRTVMDNGVEYSEKVTSFYCLGTGSQVTKSSRRIMKYLPFVETVINHAEGGKYPEYKGELTKFYEKFLGNLARMASIEHDEEASFYIERNHSRYWSNFNRVMFFLSKRRFSRLVLSFIARVLRKIKRMMISIVAA